MREIRPSKINRRAIFAVVGFVVSLAGLFVATEAIASATIDSPYGYERTWNAGLRMVRVDMGFKVDEKDEKSGYIMFQYHSAESGEKVSSGSMEFVRPKDDESPVKVMVQLPAMPRYHEQVMLDQLTRKMREEYGEPPVRPHHDPAPAAPADAGADADDESR